VVLLALNLLIPVGLQVSALDDGASCSALGGASALGSAGLNGTNSSLRSYVDANFHMIVQFLRDRLTARYRGGDDKRVALHALGQVGGGAADFRARGGTHLSWKASRVM
jgi:hypothetical protein